MAEDIRALAEAARGRAKERAVKLGASMVVTQAEPGYDAGLDHLEAISGAYPDLAWNAAPAEKAQLLGGTDDPTLVGQLASVRVRGKLRRTVTVHTSGSIVWQNVDPIAIV